MDNLATLTIIVSHLLNIIQNNMLRIILKKQRIVEPKILDLIFRVKTINIRWDERFLKSRNHKFKKQTLNNNPAIQELIDEIKKFLTERLPVAYLVIWWQA